MTPFVKASGSDRLFESLSQLPSILSGLDGFIEALGMPVWTLAFVLIVAFLSFVFASREFLAWFLKTNAIADEVIRLELLVRELQRDLKDLEKMVANTKGLTQAVDESKPQVEPSPHFPLHH